MKKKILVVEDEIKISRSICNFLGSEGYNFQHAENGLDALSLFKEFKPDLIILDIMLPKMDGLLVCEHIRTLSNTPIIMLTGRVDDEDKLIGFITGADDYMCKPFNPKELMARVKAILKRVNPPILNNILTHGPICLIINEHRVTINDIDIQLTQMEFSLLSTFMAHPNQVFSREDLLTSTQGHNSESYDRTIDFHIKNLRKKINIEDHHQYIKTVYGIGYKFLNTA